MTNPRVLIGNIYFSPTSFGGATIVAEHMATRLKENFGWDVVVVASIDDPDILPYQMRRFESKGLDIFGVKLPPISPYEETSWNNPQFNKVFGEILDRSAPDVVHMHSIQNFGATSLLEAVQRKIPVAVTLHDCWFICERQFMINHAGRYCDQTKIDMNVCRYCVPEVNKTKMRFDALQEIQKKADLLLYPSAFHRQIHVANGAPAKRSKVNKNGIKLPNPLYKRKPNPNPEKHKLRFGFIGGPGPIKGASLMARAFKKLKRTDYEVIVVDGAANVGQSWIHDPVWADIPGDVRFVSAYNQDTIDDVFAEMDILLFPSQWKESFGLTVREAIARGTWVLTTDAGGVAEDCFDGENAKVIKMDGRVDTLATAISDLFRNPPQSAPKSDHIVSVDQQAENLDEHLRTLLKTA